MEIPASMDPRLIHIDQFDYPLPDGKIARYPLEERDQSKLLVFKQGKIQDATFNKIQSFLPENALLIFNESSVINARLFFKNDKGATIEVFCLEPEEEVSKALSARGRVTWRCLVGGLKKWKQETLSLNAGPFSLHAKIIERRSEDVVVGFSWTPGEKDFAEVLSAAGLLPIPPYLNRDTEEIDNTRYQTVYAGDKGSVAAPTAGLHFTPSLIDSLEEKGIKTLKISLHVGSGTFKPVKADQLGGHSMHAEWLTVSRNAIGIISEHVKNGRPLITVGTTSLRATESLFWLGAKLLKNADPENLSVSQWDPYEGLGDDVGPLEALYALARYMDERELTVIYCNTSLLIAPPYRLRFANGLITNFHQPRSTLLLLVAAFTGDKWKDIYAHALANNYRFLSYGDSSLLFN